MYTDSRSNWFSTEKMGVVEVELLPIVLVYTRPNSSAGFASAK
jgi:hypothetical protein